MASEQKMMDLLALVKKHEPISIYSLFKKTHYVSYSSVHHLIELLEMKGDIQTKHQIKDNGKLARIIISKS